jgi:hypothetical protein
MEHMAQSTASRVTNTYELIGQHHASRALDSVYMDYSERPVEHLLGASIVIRNQKLPYQKADKAKKQPPGILPRATEYPGISPGSTPAKNPVLTLILLAVFPL